jgi:hypothetical protein
MDGWMDGFIDADPSLWAICSLALWIKYMLSSTRLYHFLDELGASSGPVVAYSPLLLSCLHGTRLRNRWDASAKSKTASTVLARGALSGPPLLPSPDPPTSVEMQLNASPTFSRSSRRNSLSAGQSSRTCITLSRSPQTHRSSSRNPKAFAYVDSQQCPVRSCVSRYARFLGRDP